MSYKLRGYVFISKTEHGLKEHPRANKQGAIREHHLVLEKTLGRPVLAIEAPHHIDGDKANNAVGNLMLFQTHSMHHAYHKRLKAFGLCGHYDWRKCNLCHEWDDPKNLSTNIANHAYHRACMAAKSKRRRAEAKVRRG